ncbi:glycosyl transferase [Pararhizobium antarcticum]|uniref:Glycosyl transferase n=1 Tax=Pararhizobium antarcticum TaxID=1798805 RepID=A0A657LZ06_9HYPH|nr:glycosyl transferase [Pararhizobium antarcticum]OJF90436.1 glycosyl transferase [Rhizobium sp. 58]OJG00616.1 glycosyl transferase [Pararhizobium antarcticum]
MLTIILETRDDEAELAQTLSALVSGAVEGLVSDVIILDHGSHDGSSRVADAAGCRFLTHWDMKDVVRSVRGEWLMLLQAGARPSGRWIDDVAEYIALNKAPGRFSPSRLHRKPFFQRIGRRPAALEHGFLISKRQAVASAKTGMLLADLARGHSVRRLATEIVPAWVAAVNRPLAEDD